MDGIEFFNKELNKIAFPYFLRSQRSQQLAWRLTGFEAWMKGRCSFRDAFRNLLPARFKNETVQQRLWEYTEQNFGALLDSRGIYKSNQISLFGHPFYPAAEKSPVNSWLSAFKTISEAIVSDQYHAKEFIKENSVVIDAGANIGAFSVFAANLAPKVHVYSFEPTPGTFEILKRNAVTYPHITVFEKALGDVEKIAKLMMSENAPAANTLIDSGRLEESADFAKEFKKTVKVNVTTIDGLVDKLKIPRVDFLKMDVEGYEKRILIGAKNTIRRFSPVMSMSAYHHPNDKKELPAFIQSIAPDYKYKIYMENEEDIVFWK